MSGSASDGGSGLTAVTLQYRSTTGSWTDICTNASSPLSCSWSTAALADGYYDLRTVATDAAGNSQISNPVYNRRVDSTPPTVDDDRTRRRRRQHDHAAVDQLDGAEGSGVISVRYEYKLSSDSAWTPRLHVVHPAVLVLVQQRFGRRRALRLPRDRDRRRRQDHPAAVTSRRIDNTAPATAELAVLPSPLRNTVPMTATATDLGSGIADVKFQYAPTGTTSWTDACTDASDPYTCSLSDHGHQRRDLRPARARHRQHGEHAGVGDPDTHARQQRPHGDADEPGHGRERPRHDQRRLDGDEGSPASRPSPSGTGAWAWPPGRRSATTPRAPYSCPLNTTTLTSGASYEIQLIGTDALLQTTTTAPITVTVDNVAPIAVDIQAVNGGTANTMDAGDALTFTYSEPMLPASLLSGWDGECDGRHRPRVTNSGANNSSGSTTARTRQRST